MVEKEIQVVNKLGLHARAAAKLVSLASSFKSTIDLGREGRTVNGKSIMGVMMLAASKGTQLKIKVEGSDETEALRQIEELFAGKFGETE
ncbi:MAG TPA: HPr family phosphocarrier protein [Gammaproteobacteria bacterium]|nr:HPr family phosphocarrier protein [Gammaproteobacteria bacterium]